MAKHLNKDVVYKAAKPKEKDYMVNDGEGLYLFVGKAGSKLWRFIYTFDRKQKKLALGSYPGISLEAARVKAQKARDNIADGLDPIEIKNEKKKAKLLMQLNDDRITDGLPILKSFKDLAIQWLNSEAHITNALTKKKKTERHERSAFPYLGDIPIDKIKSSDILAALQPLIDKKQLSTAHRLHSEISALFDYAIVHDYAVYDMLNP